MQEEEEERLYVCMPIEIKSRSNMRVEFCIDAHLSHFVPARPGPLASIICYKPLRITTGSRAR